MNKNEFEVERTFTSDKKILSEIEQTLKAFQDVFYFDNEKFYEILVSITEAVINAIQHGNKNNPKKKVFLKIRGESDKLTVEVLDEGEGFDLSSIQDPRTPENILKERGRGIFIIHSFADSVQLESGKTGTKVIMTFKI